MTRVLVVDDDLGIVQFLRSALEDEGYQVSSTVNGETMAQVDREPPDLILLDIMMPGMDGIEVSQRLRANPSTALIPIVAMSAQNRLNATYDVFPVDERLAKPFELDQLYTTVARWAPAP